MICRQCGIEIADKALICYRCGTATTEAKFQPAVPSKRRRRPAVAIAVVVAVLLAILAVVLFFMQ
jgi:uncharacterized membrane protein YvbJ